MDNKKFAIIEQVLRNHEALDCLALANRILANAAISQVECTKLLADWYYAKQDYVNCLVACSFYCDVKGCNDQLLEVLGKYCNDFIKQARQNYEENRHLLTDYQWYRGELIVPYDKLESIVIYQDDSKIICVERSTGNMNVADKDTNKLVDQYKQVILTAGVNNIAALVDIKSHCIMKIHPELWMKRPLYIYYKDDNDFALVLQTGKVGQIIVDENSVFLLGWHNAEKFLNDLQSHPVGKIIFRDGLPVEEMYAVNNGIKKLVQTKEKLYTEMLHENTAWYNEHASQVKQNISGGKPKILFVTSRFTTALQYHTRDCMESCRKLGCRVELLIDKSDIHATYNYAYIKAINEFKPDIIFCIDHFRVKIVMPQEIVHVCWAQDPMDHLVNLNIEASLDENQYILALFRPSKELVSIGYDKERVMDSWVPADEQVYRPYELTAIEWQDYVADIILVANNSCYETHLNDFSQQFASYGEVVIDGCIDVFRQYYQLVREEKIKLIYREDMYAYLKKSLQLLPQPINLPEVAFNTVAEHFHLQTRSAAFRSALVEWLIDGGYTNLKLYGRDWGDDPKFAPYAMGMAKNGEPLAKIYQAGKILLGSNPVLTGTARVYECFLSGGFYIANYICPEADPIDLRDRFTEGEEIPFFYNKQDLYDKIDYYLANDNERKRISYEVRQKMLQNYTYKILIQNMLQWLREKVSKGTGE